MTLEDQLQDDLTALASQNQHRSVRAFGGADRSHPTAANGSKLVSFCSNDYLGLADHPAVLAGAFASAQSCGFGAASSRLLAGSTPAHAALEQALAHHLQKPAALLFPTGYQANLGTLTALAGPQDLIASDAANHASIIDGCRLSRARLAVYPHVDAVAARAALATPGTFRRRFLVTESLFSMDGDRAPLRDLASACRDTDSILLVDEAHALGMVGPEGRGLAVESGVSPDVTIGTLGKSFGSLGGFAAGSIRLIETLVNRARTFIFTTAAPPPIVAAAHAALALSAGTDGQERRRHALGLAQTLRHGLLRFGLPAPGQDLIVPVVLGSEAAALAASSALFARGLLVPAIRPPTVAAGTSRLRITVTASHSQDDISQLLQGLAQACAGISQ